MSYQAHALHIPSRSVRRPRRRLRPCRQPSVPLRTLARLLAFYEVSAYEVYAGPNWRQCWRLDEPGAFAFSEEARLDLLAAGACIGCGCTEDSACGSGCYWIQPGWCSECGDRLALDSEGE